jgi:pseudaminic acid biosynthesis-associated methylase
MSTQLENWRSEFGRGYTDRNVIDCRTRLPAFRSMLEGLPLSRVLEVGCNRGHNLVTLSEVLGEGTEIVGIEPNAYAIQIARAANPQAGVLQGNILDLPFKEEYFDLVCTIGVLIHIPLASLRSAICELARVSSRYLLAAEYFADDETEIPYRGQNDLLWKRNFARHFEETLPGIDLLRSGYWGPEDGFDRVHWWLYQRPRTEP